MTPQAPLKPIEPHDSASTQLFAEMLHTLKSLHPIPERYPQTPKQIHIYTPSQNLQGLSAFNIHPFIGPKGFQFLTTIIDKDLESSIIAAILNNTLMFTYDYHEVTSIFNDIILHYNKLVNIVNKQHPFINQSQTTTPKDTPTTSSTYNYDPNDPNAPKVSYTHPDVQVYVAPVEVNAPSVLNPNPIEVTIKKSYDEREEQLINNVVDKVVDKIVYNRKMEMKKSSNW